MNATNFGCAIPQQIVTCYKDIIIPTYDERHYALKARLASSGGFYTNSIGFRSQEISVTTKGKSPSVAFLGDSVVMGAKVEDNLKTFPELFKIKADISMTTLNGGCSCYNSRQMYFQLVLLYKHISPDHIFLHTPVNEVTLGAQLGENWAEGKSWVARFGFDEHGKPTNIPKLNQIHTVPDVAIKTLYKNMLLCAKYCIKKGSKIYLVTAPRLLKSNVSLAFITDLHKKGFDPNGNLRKERFLGQSIDIINDYTRRLGKQLGVHVIDLAEMFDEKLKPKIFLDYFHYNEVGHMLVADILFNAARPHLIS